ncbi:MAG: hypothetical protein U0414_01605 [Polyangiaceae bacterium]
MPTDETQPESAALSTKRDDGPPTTIDERAPDTRVDPERADEAIAGLKGITRTVQMSDADPIVDPGPPASRASSPSEEEVITLKRAQDKPVLAGAAAEPAARSSEAPEPSTTPRKKKRKSKIDDTQPDPPQVPIVAADAPVTPRAPKKRAIRETLPDPDAHPLEPTVDDRVVAPAAPPKAQRRVERKAPSPLSNPLVWVVGALMIAALVAFGIFLSSTGGEAPAKKPEKSARASISSRTPPPQAASSLSANTPLPQPTHAPDVPAPTPEPTTTTQDPTPSPRPTPTTPHPKPTPNGSASPFPTFILPTSLPSFPGIGTSPPAGSGATGP